MDNPCPAYIGCAGDCNECSYIGDDDMYKQMKEMFEKCQADNVKLQAELKLYKRVADLMAESFQYSCPDKSEWDNCGYGNAQSCYEDGYHNKCLKTYFITKAKEEAPNEQNNPLP